MQLTTILTDAVNAWTGRDHTVGSSSPKFPDVSAAPPDTRRLIRDRRYCHLMSMHNDMPFDDVSISCAWKALESEMALVPAGEVAIASEIAVRDQAGLGLSTLEAEMVPVDAFLLDKHCVTNADFGQFVHADGYTNPQLWPEGLLPNVLQFVDADGQPGPRGWRGGNPPPGKSQHPVVGVCWYEANAYAMWVGKRLPATTEWQRAGTWANGGSGNASELRYPWGNAFEPKRANTWSSRVGDTIPAHEGASGQTRNGIRQLIGNVWEWVDAQFQPHATDEVSVLLDQAMAEIRGGAFDTYFASHATCQFRTGQPLLFRGSNVGFRCCADAAQLPVHSSSSPLNSETIDQ